MGLRVRKKRNSSGSVSIHIVDRTNRGYKLVESLGSSKDEEEIEKLYKKALDKIDEIERNLLYSLKKDEKKEQLKKVFEDVTTENFIPIGDELVFGRLFDKIGCKDIFRSIDSKKIRDRNKKDFLFRSLVISRLLYPGSKLELELHS